MKLNSVRELSGLKPVLKNPISTGLDPIYWVFGEVTDGKWANITITASGKIGEEYPKTFGHYHSVEVNETYHVISGRPVFVLQKKHFEDGVWQPEKVDEVYLIKAQPGDEVTITPEYGHSSTNAGQEPLITYDDWRSGHQPSDYEQIEKLQGMAYYLVEEGGEVKAMPNPHYQDLPEPKWVTAAEFRERHVS